MSHRGRRPRHQPPGLADFKGHVARAVDTAHNTNVITYTPAGDSIAWMVGRVLVLTPQIRDGAPDEVLGWITLRAVASARAECPLCGAAGGVTRVGHQQIAHEPGCELRALPAEYERWVQLWPAA